MDQTAGYRKINAWKKADELTLLTYQLTKNFPKSEIFGLVSQLRRAALSVPTNIVEGYARNGNAEFKRFLVISLGSLAEVKYLWEVSVKIGYISQEEYQQISSLADETGRLLWGFYKAI